jgi:hypothetical protein
MSEFDKNLDDSLNPYRPNQGLSSGSGQQGNPSVLTALAVSLIVFAIINLMVTVATPFAGPMVEESMKEFFLQMVPEEDRQEFLESFEQGQQNPLGDLEPVFTWGGMILGSILGIVQLIGAFSILNRSSFGWGLTSCIVSLVPLWTCCCLFDLGIGIWGIILLNQPAYKNMFNRTSA